MARPDEREFPGCSMTSDREIKPSIAPPLSGPAQAEGAGTRGTAPGGIRIEQTAKQLLVERTLGGQILRCFRSFTAKRLGGLDRSGSPSGQQAGEDSIASQQQACRRKAYRAGQVAIHPVGQQFSGEKVGRAPNHETNGQAENCGAPGYPQNLAPGRSRRQANSELRTPRFFVRRGKRPR